MIQSFVRKAATMLQFAEFALRYGVGSSKIVLGLSLLQLKLERLGVDARHPRRILFELEGRRYPWLFRPADIFIAKEQLSGSGYLQGDLAKSSILSIVDIGAHAGFSVLRFARDFPDALIDAYEPSPENFRLLNANVGVLSGVRCFPVALAKETGPISFCLNPQRPSNNFLYGDQATSDGSRIITCQGITLDDLLASARKPIDLLKFDIEALEYEVFRNSKLIKDVPHIVGEIKASDAHLSRFLALFPSHRVLKIGVGNSEHILYLFNQEIRYANSKKWGGGAQ